jgi:hypothetical protein
MPVIPRIVHGYFIASGLMELAPKSRTRIDLISFANVASFAYIQANLADDANGNAVITLGNGETSPPPRSLPRTSCSTSSRTHHRQEDLVGDAVDGAVGQEEQQRFLVFPPTSRSMSAAAPASPAGLKAITALIVLRDKAILFSETRPSNHFSLPPRD